MDCGVYSLKKKHFVDTHSDKNTFKVLLERALRYVYLYINRTR